MRDIIQKKLFEAVELLNLVEGLANNHLVNFLTNNLWSQLPRDILKDFDNFQLVKYFVENYKQIHNQHEIFTNYPNVAAFITKFQQFQIDIENTCMLPVSFLKTKLENLGGTWPEFEEIKNFVSQKKKHEVQRIVQISESLGMCKNCRVLDLGGGKGYLSTILAQKKFQVLSVDYSQLTTQGAAKRARKLIKAQKNKHVNPIITNFKQVSTFVTPEIEIGKLMNSHFPSDQPDFGMTGLHTCGDLAATCLRLFADHADIKWLINVGCCYHSIEEEFFTSPFWSDVEVRISNNFGFPMSQFLRERQCRLGRNARMLAAHSLDKINVDGVDYKAVRSIFYRSLLQVVVEKIRGHSLIEGQVPKRLGMKCNNITDYIRKSMMQMDLQPELSENEIDELLQTHKEEEVKLAAYFLLRVQIAPLIESIILLDRLLFLLEHGFNDAYLVPVFDPVISPRGVAIVSWKDL